MFRPIRDSAESIIFFSPSAAAAAPKKDYGTCSSCLIQPSHQSSLSLPLNSTPPPPSSSSSSFSFSSSSSSSSQSSLAERSSNNNSSSSLFEALNSLEAQTEPATKFSIPVQSHTIHSEENNTSEREKSEHNKDEEEQEEQSLNFPMSFVRSARRFYRQLQSKYIYDRVPLINVIVILLQIAAMSRLIATFNSYYDSKPLMTMMISNSILNGVADTMAQTVTSVRERAARRKGGPSSTEDPIALEIHKLDNNVPNSLRHGELIPTSDKLPPPFDFERLTRFMAWGLLMAPLQFTWFKVLSRNFPIKTGAAAAGSSSMVPALKRVACDQLVFAPVGLAAFFTYMTVAEGGGREGIKRKFDNIYIPALRSNYILWPAVQIINFRLMPIQFQLPFASTVGIFWTTYLSLTNSAADVADEE